MVCCLIYYMNASWLSGGCAASQKTWKANICLTRLWCTHEGEHFQTRESRMEMKSLTEKKVVL